MKIGNLARKAGVSVDTVRYYERRGLLPKPQRLPSGYRVYSEVSVNRIVMAKSLQALGFTLDEIADNLADLDADDVNCEQGESRMQIVLDRVEARISELLTVKDNIEKVLDQCRSGNCHFSDQTKII